MTSVFIYALIFVKKILKWTIIVQFINPNLSLANCLLATEDVVANKIDQVIGLKIMVTKQQIARFASEIPLALVIKVTIFLYQRVQFGSLFHILDMNI